MSESLVFGFGIAAVAIRSSMYSPLILGFIALDLVSGLSVQTALVTGFGGFIVFIPIDVLGSRIIGMILGRSSSVIFAS